MINLTIQNQPDGETCGPTSLYAIYQYYGLNCTLDDVIQSVEYGISGGTLSAFLGKDALRRNFQTVIYVNNLLLFDPSWFKNGECDNAFLIEKLLRQLRYKKSKKIIQASRAYIEYLELGGQVKFKTLNVPLLKKYFEQGVPILSGLSATYLYKTPREIYVNGEGFFHDIKGTPCGHFVVLCGYNDSHHLVVVADPHQKNTISNDNYYQVNIHHLINAIMLGVLTFDANLLVIQPK